MKAWRSSVDIDSGIGDSRCARRTSGGSAFLVNEFSEDQYVRAVDRIEEMVREPAARAKRDRRLKELFDLETVGD